MCRNPLQFVCVTKLVCLCVHTMCVQHMFVCVCVCVHYAAKYHIDTMKNRSC